MTTKLSFDPCRESWRRGREGRGRGRGRERGRGVAVRSGASDSCHTHKKAVDGSPILIQDLHLSHPCELATPTTPLS